MSILLVGGHERMEREYKSICNNHGCKVKVCTKLRTQFNKIIGCPDLIILFTSTVSHKMVDATVKVAKKKKIDIIRKHCSSANSLKEILSGLDLRCANYKS